MMEKTLQQVFKELDFIKVTPFARKIGINPSLLRMYVCGTRIPSPQRDRFIRRKLVELGRELKRAKIYTK